MSSDPTRWTATWRERVDLDRLSVWLLVLVFVWIGPQMVYHYLTDPATSVYTLFGINLFLSIGVLTTLSALVAVGWLVLDRRDHT